MNRIKILLFAIPLISMAVIAFYQLIDESFVKKFVLERRAASSAGEAGTHRRRYSDPVPPGSLRNPETANPGPNAEVSVPQIHGV
jgi:hypothetical protein